MTTLATRLQSLPLRFGATFFALYLVSQSTIAALLGKKVGAELVPMQLAFTKSRFDEIVGSWTEENIEQLQHHYYLDFLHPAWYGITLAWALAKTLPERLQKLVWLPVVAAICDLSENILHAVPAFTGSFHAMSQPAIAVSSTFAAIKWSLALTSVVLVLVFYLRHRQR